MIPGFLDTISVFKMIYICKAYLKELKPLRII